MTKPKPYTPPAWQLPHLLAAPHKERIDQC